MFMIILAILILSAVIVLPSIRIIGPTDIGLITKKFASKSLSDDNPIAFNGEAGYQSDLLMPGWHFKLWIMYRVEKFPWVQIPANEIGVVIAQIGESIPAGCKSAAYKSAFGNFSDIKTFIEEGGQKGLQRPVLAPGTVAPIHPAAFIVITREKVYGLPTAPEYQQLAHKNRLSPEEFGLQPKALNVTKIEPRAFNGRIVDMVGIVTTLEGEPLKKNDIAGRLGDFDDVSEFEKQPISDATIIDKVLASQNDKHNNYQDFQAFLDNGGKIGLQHDVLLYGAYNLNPFLVTIEIVPMLVVEQGEVAVIKSYVGLKTDDVSGTEFKYGSLVKPGHRGLWVEPLRTGKYPINPRCYEAVKVPTSILTLNWANQSSAAHNLDHDLTSIGAKSCEGFEFTIDLQVQIHIADTQASKVISIVGTIPNLVNEVLQAAVGNHFRDKLQSMKAVDFIQQRQEVQEKAFHHMVECLTLYAVETRGVYIQNVTLPPELVKVLKEREIANQEITTFDRQRDSQMKRIEMEKAKGVADMQKDLSTSSVKIEIKKNEADAKKAEADGEAYYTSETGKAEGQKRRAIGMADADAYKAQVDALGQTPTAMVNIAKSLAEHNIKVVPDILVTGGSGSFEGLAATIMKHFASIGKSTSDK